MERLIDWKTTALVLIDLQNWTKSSPLVPYSAADVATKAASLVEAFRAHEAFVVLVKVTSKDWKDLRRPKLDKPAPAINTAPGWDEFMPEIKADGQEHVISKKQWGAFYGTDLDLQLRRRGINTIVIGGIASGLGVDTTAREAWQHNYELIFASDAMSGFSQLEQDYVQQVIFPRIGRLRTTAQILENAPLEAEA